jgi:anti-sigma regulatory factor (Ser/Thr protein kinase)
VNVSQQDSRADLATTADAHAKGDHPVTAIVAPHTGVPRFTPAPPIPAADDHSWPDQWPRRSELELAALETAPSCAHAHAHAVMWEWKVNKDTADEALAVVSELVTNAVTSTQVHRVRAPVCLRVLGDEASVLILVWDATMPAPVPAPASPEAEHGRGLAIVESLSVHWGWYFSPGRPGGKVVWALMSPADPPAALTSEQRLLNDEMTKRETL